MVRGISMRSSMATGCASLGRFWENNGYNVLIMKIVSAIVMVFIVWAPGPRESTCKRERLFNKRDLTGWYSFLRGAGRNRDSLGVFTVNKGLLHISGQEFGCITTQKEYENFHLIAEYKWGKRTWGDREGHARDCGILIHSTGPDGAYDGAWMRAIECQIIEGGTGDLILMGDGTSAFSITCPVASAKQEDCYVFKPSGATASIEGSGRINWEFRDPAWKDTEGYRGSVDVEKPAGEWNKLECVAHNGEVYLYLNDRLVNHATRVRPSRGHIQLQSEGAEILFRRIDLYSERCK